MKKILVIGGSYFTGRVFSILCSRRDDMELHVVNRGRYQLNMDHVTEYVCDRHDTDRFRQLFQGREFDAVVDFCAYEPLDIDSVLQVLGKGAGHYLYLSTSSVYEPETGFKKTEQSPLIKDFGPGDPIAEYIFKKAILEVELEKAAAQAGIPYTILRPASIYGPYNYAPRESYFVELIVHGKPVPKVTDSHALFNFVYVVDVANALIGLAANPDAFDQVFNLAAPEDVDYSTYYQMLETCNEGPYDTEDVTVRQVLEENIPLPFPLEENELCNGEKLQQVLEGFQYTPFEEGMRKAFNAFKGVYAD